MTPHPFPNSPRSYDFHRVKVARHHDRGCERIVLDLKEEVLPLLTPEPQASTGARVPVDAAGLVDDARAVLVNLGWKGKQVEAALDKVAQKPGDPLGLDELVRRALAKLMER